MKKKGGGGKVEIVIVDKDISKKEILERFENDRKKRKISSQKRRDVLKEKQKENTIF